MAELVHLLLEHTLPELEEMERIGLFNRKEIGEIVIKKKAFEYKLCRMSKSKEDILKYIEYEMNLLELIGKRRKRLMCDHHKKDEIDYHIAKRINRLFKDAIFRYSEDTKTLAKSNSILQKDKKIKELWVMAAKYEMEEIQLLENARKVFQKGILLNPHSELLWQEYFRMELMYIDLIRKHKAVLEAKSVEKIEVDAEDVIMNGQIAHLVYDGAVEECPDVEYALSFIQICLDFDFGSKHIDYILQNVRERFPDKAEMMDALAKEPLLNVQEEIKRGKEQGLKKCSAMNSATGQRLKKAAGNGMSKVIDSGTSIGAGLLIASEKGAAVTRATGTAIKYAAETTSTASRVLGGIKNATYYGLNAARMTGAGLKNVTKAVSEKVSTWDTKTKTIVGVSAAIAAVPLAGIVTASAVAAPAIAAAPSAIASSSIVGGLSAAAGSAFTAAQGYVTAIGAGSMLASAGATASSAIAAAQGSAAVAAAGSMIASAGAVASSALAAAQGSAAAAAAGSVLASAGTVASSAFAAAQGSAAVVAAGSALSSAGAAAGSMLTAAQSSAIAASAGSALTSTGATISSALTAAQGSAAITNAGAAATSVLAAAKSSTAAVTAGNALASAGKLAGSAIAAAQASPAYITAASASSSAGAAVKGTAVYASTSSFLQSAAVAEMSASTKAILLVPAKAALGAGVAVAGAKVALPAAGFTAGGVAAGSVAAAVHSAIGNVAAGSTFALLQSAGAAGMAASTQAAIGTAGAAIAVVL